MTRGRPYIQHPLIPGLDSLHDLSTTTHLSPGLLFKLSKHNSWYYKVYTIPKSSGGVREIAEPARPMKAVQYWISENILQHLPLHPAATGFRKGQSTLKNANIHKNNKYVLCLDLNDFFPSIKYPFVYTIFHSLGYNMHVSHILASLCTLNGRLPQGGVTSPILSNLCCVRLDRRISGYCGPRNIAYTRYADDMTFSSMSSKRLVGLYQRVKTIIEDEHFALNEAKTRYMGPARRKKITGLVVGDGQAGIGRKLERTIRASIYNLSKNNELAGISWTEEQLRGWLAYLHSVDLNRHQRMIKYIRGLSVRLDIPILRSRLGIN